MQTPVPGSPMNSQPFSVFTGGSTSPSTEPAAATKRPGLSGRGHQGHQRKHHGHDPGGSDRATATTSPTCHAAPPPGRRSLRGPGGVAPEIRPNLIASPPNLLSRAALLV